MRLTFWVRSCFNRSSSLICFTSDNKMATNDTKETSCSSKDSKLSKPLCHNGVFNNPWSTWRDLTPYLIFKFYCVYKDHSNVPPKKVLDQTLPILKPNFDNWTKNEDGIQVMWVGHATVLVKFDGLTIMADPMFSQRVGPYQVPPWTKRYRDPPCNISDLPHIDAVLISHNHYDHLDYYSVIDLHKKYGDALRWYIPMGMRSWMASSGIDNTCELTWWEEVTHPGRSDVKFVSTPCQHWSGRNGLDRNKVLWSSWCVISEHHRFYFAGDTGYCSTFTEIGDKYGPFSLAAIPIGAFKPRVVTKPQHVDPAEAVQIHRDIKSSKSVGIHWGTFAVSHEPYLSPREKLQEALDENGIDQSDFITMSHGEIIQLK